MRSALTKVEGVSEAVVSMPNKAVVTTKAGVKTEDLIKAVKAAGFSAKEKMMDK